MDIQVDEISHKERRREVWLTGVTPRKTVLFRVSGGETEGAPRENKYVTVDGKVTA